MSNWCKEISFRMVQTNLREIDMLNMDAGSYVSDLQDLGANVALINAAGIIASYQTDLKYHFQSPYLSGDGLDAIIQRCHAAGIKVFARTDFSKIRMEIYEQHPEWAYRTADGGLAVYNGDVHACVNGGYQQEYQFEIIRELLTRFDFDGIFYNMSGFQTVDYSYNEYGLCHCEACKRKFRQMYGLELPRTADMKDPTYRKYRRFTEICNAEHERALAKFVKDIGKHIAINGHDYQHCESNTELGRPLPSWQYSASSNTRCCAGPMEDRVPVNADVDFIGFPYRHIAVSPWQQELRLWQALANRGGLDYYLMGLIGNHRDRSGFDGVRKVFRFHQQHEALLVPLKSAAKALVLRTALWQESKEICGWIRALTEAHIPFDEVLLSEITDARMLERYDCVIAAGVRWLSDAQAAMLDGYVDAGGILLATAETGFGDEQYEDREGCAIQSLGLTKVNWVENRWEQISAMYLVDDEADRAAFPHFDRSAYVAPGQKIIYADMAPDAQRYLKLIPKHMFGPPERCYYTRTTEIPGLTVHEHGRGKAIYIPFEAGALFYQEGHLNSEWFMWDVLHSFCGLAGLSDTLTPQVETTLSVDGNRTVVQLVNVSGHFGNSYYPPLKVADIDLMVPVSGEVRRVYGLTGEAEISWEQRENDVQIHLSHLNSYEGIVIE